MQPVARTGQVPAGWWHAVLNMDATVAITGNVLMPCTLHGVWAAMDWPAPQLHSFARECARRWPELREGENAALCSILGCAPLLPTSCSLSEGTHCRLAAARGGMPAASLRVACLDATLVP